MKVLVYPHDLSLGGSQINAIDLAAEVVRAGHHAIVYGVEGPLTEHIRSKGLEFHAANPQAARPSPRRIAELVGLCRRERVDVIHAYEWPPCLDAYYGAHLVLGIPMVCSVLSMWVSPLVPATVPLVMGTTALGDRARRERRGKGAEVFVLEPPIDIIADHPRIDGGKFRRDLGIGDDELVVVSVSRLTTDLKLDALKDAIDAAAILEAERPIRMVMVGSGDAESELRHRAGQVNVAVGREVVILPGSMLDPRPAYAAADVVVGMGSSALRAMAHAKPVVVQGERGWVLPCGPDTIDRFLYEGFFGEGTGRSGGKALAVAVGQLLENADLRQKLGEWGRELVVGRFSLQAAATSLIEILKTVRSEGSRADIGRQAAAFAQVSGRAFMNEMKYHLPGNKRWQAAERQRKLQASVEQVDR